MTTFQRLQVLKYLIEKLNVDCKSPDVGGYSTLLDVYNGKQSALYKNVIDFAIYCTQNVHQSQKKIVTVCHNKENHDGGLT